MRSADLNMRSADLDIRIRRPWHVSTPGAKETLNEWLKEDIDFWATYLKRNRLNLT